MNGYPSLFFFQWAIPVPITHPLHNSKELMKKLTE